MSNEMKTYELSVDSSMGWYIKNQVKWMKVSDLTPDDYEELNSNSRLFLIAYKERIFKLTYTLVQEFFKIEKFDDGTLYLWSLSGYKFNKEHRTAYITALEIEDWRVEDIISSYS
ncbi:hypothetical protein [Trichodesmium erythraeum]|uniref:hypothetical protein n=1 Tax=Trichodesmium erythraeum TaxID=1206 RepID=UPI0000392ED5